MPFITIKTPVGIINREMIDQFKKELVETVLRVEGAPSNVKSKSIAFLILNEVKGEDWCIGGEGQGQSGYIVELKLPSGVLDSSGKNEMVKEIHKIFSNFTTTAIDPMQAWVIITEVVDGNWGFGEKIFKLEDIAEYINSE